MNIVCYIIIFISFSKPILSFFQKNILFKLKKLLQFNLQNDSQISECLFARLSFASVPGQG